MAPPPKKKKKKKQKINTVLPRVLAWVELESFNFQYIKRASLKVISR